MEPRLVDSHVRSREFLTVRPFCSKTRPACTITALDALLDTLFRGRRTHCLPYGKNDFQHLTSTTLVLHVVVRAACGHVGCVGANKFLSVDQIRQVCHRKVSKYLASCTSPPGFVLTGYKPPIMPLRTWSCTLMRRGLFYVLVARPYVMNFEILAPSTKHMNLGASTHTQHK